jgi:membrane protein implicated in regulation of membrane protease activity
MKAAIKAVRNDKCTSKFIAVALFLVRFFLLFFICCIANLLAQVGMMLVLGSKDKILYFISLMVLAILMLMISIPFFLSKRNNEEREKHEIKIRKTK